MSYFFTLGRNWGFRLKVVYKVRKEYIMKKRIVPMIICCLTKTWVEETEEPDGRSPLRLFFLLLVFLSLPSFSFLGDFAILPSLTTSLSYFSVSKYVVYWWLIGERFVVLSVTTFIDWLYVSIWVQVVVFVVRPLCLFWDDHSARVSVEIRFPPRSSTEVLEFQ